MRKLACILVSIAILTASVGVPITGVPAAVDLGGEDFPCRNHGCGCQNAEMCRTQCCCFGPSTPKPVVSDKPDSCCSAKKTPRSVACSSAKSPNNEKTRFAFRSAGCSGVAWNLVTIARLFVSINPLSNLPSLQPQGVLYVSLDSITPLSSVIPVTPPPRHA